jgi:predicted nucleotidyltransferase
MIYEDVLKAFEEEGIRYLIVGGVAVNLYGYVRLTVDLDIMVDLEESNLIHLIRVMEKLNYTPRVPVKPIDFTDVKNREVWIREKGAVVFTFIDLIDPVKHIDIFLKNPIDFEHAYHERKVLALKDIKINLVSVEDLIAMKQLSGRPRDIEDITHLRKVLEMKKRKANGT